MFPAYLAIHPTWSQARLTNDLHIGGVLMWVGGDTLMLWPMIPVALGWMHLEERKAVRIDRQLDAVDEASDARLAEFLAGPSNAVEP
jgi:cytochrome c oxidase assembly factor CtaG